MFKGIVLCNSLEWAEWAQNPVQVEICEQCGIVRCATGGYVHASRISEHIFLTRPRATDDDTWSEEEYTPGAAIRQFGALAVPTAIWQRWGQVVSLPSATVFPMATGEVLGDVWLSGIPSYYGCHTLADVLPMLRRYLLAADSMEIDLAIAKVAELISLIEKWTGRPTDGSMIPIPSEALKVEKLYLDGPTCKEWPAFAMKDNKALPLLSSEWALTIEEPT